MHLSIPTALIPGGARPPTMIQQLRPEDNIFVPRIPGGEISTKSSHALRYCRHTKFHEIIRRYGERQGDDKCWFSMPTAPSSSRLTHGYHRWQNKEPSVRGRWTCTKFVLSHGTKACTKDDHGFDLFEFKHANPQETAVVYMMKCVKRIQRKISHALVETGSGSQSVVLPPGHQSPVVDNEKPMPARQVRSYVGYQAKPSTQAAEASKQVYSVNLRRSINTFPSADYTSRPNGSLGDFRIYDAIANNAAGGKELCFSMGTNPLMKSGWNPANSNCHNSSSWPGLLSETLQQRGVKANINCDAINNGAAITGFSPNGNHNSASLGPLAELLPPSVFDANNNESEVAHHNSGYHAGLSAAQGNQRADTSGTACFTSLPMSNSLHMGSTSTFSSIDYHSGPSGTVGDSFEAYSDINCDDEWYEEYFRK